MGVKDVQRRGDVTIIETDRQVTSSSQERLRSLVREEIENGGARIVLDFSGTEVVDSSGLGEIVRLHNLAQERDGRLCLCDLQEGSRLLVKLTKLESVLEIFSTRDEALASLEGSPPAEA